MHRYILKSIIILILLTEFSFSKKLETILGEEYITVGVKYDYKPFAFINSLGKLDGFDIDLIKSMMDRINVRVKFIEVSSNDKEKMLLNDKIDILLAGMVPSENQNSDIFFSKSYFSDEQIVLVNSKEKINSFADLKGMHVGSIRGSTRLEKFLKIQPEVTSVLFTQYPQLIRALYYNNINAITADFSWAREQMKMHNGKFKILDDVICSNNYAIAIKSNNVKLREKINSLFDDISNDKTYENIYNKWFH